MSEVYQKHIGLQLFFMGFPHLRQKHKNNAPVFHTGEGGAVPTLTHHA